MKEPTHGPQRPALLTEIAEGTVARTAKGQAAVDKILTAAIELLVHEGYAALSMRKVADRLNMRLSAVQHHFPTWEALFQAMMGRVLTGYVGMVEQHLNETRSSRLKQFESVVNYLVRDLKSPLSQSLFGQMWGMAQTNDYIRRIMHDMYAYERHIFEFFIAELNPALDKKDVAHRAALMVAQTEGLMLLIPQQTRFPVELAGIEQVCVDLVVALALAPPARSSHRIVE